MSRTSRTAITVKKAIADSLMCDNFPIECILSD